MLNKGQRPPPKEWKGVTYANVIHIFIVILHLSLVLMRAGSSVSIVSGYGLDNWAMEVRSPAEAEGFFL
jgi:hypothetical protein